MTKAEALRRLRAREVELRALGIDHVAIFGSTARDEQRDVSDLDLAVHLRPDIELGLSFFTLGERISELVGVPVDLVTEPVRKPRLRAEIDRDRVHVF